MTETVKVALIGVAGVIIGSIISIVVQFVISYKEQRSENRRSIYKLRIETYADAIRYISLCCQVYIHTNMEDYSEYVKRADDLYYRFHPLLSILEDDKTLMEYNELRNDASDGKIKAEEAYKKVMKILNYNISNEK